MGLSLVVTSQSLMSVLVSNVDEELAGLATGPEYAFPNRLPVLKGSWDPFTKRFSNHPGGFLGTVCWLWGL